MHYDSLTNIFNRHGIFHKLKNHINNKEFLIYFLDLNNFKSINDKYGHDIGDDVLIEFVRRINLHVDSDKIFGRMGGDEFLLLQLTSSSQHQMDEFWKKVYKEFETPIIQVNGEDVFLTFSKGVATYTPNKDIIDDVISRADKMMYMEKKEFHKKQNV